MIAYNLTVSSFSLLENKEEKYPDSIAMTVLDHKVVDKPSHT